MKHFYRIIENMAKERNSEVINIVFWAVAPCSLVVTTVSEETTVSIFRVGK
jgi:hypothetical protein